MKTVIYYRSFFHGTEMYAKWLAEELNADLYTYGWFNKANFEGYDRVIAMSAAYMFKFCPVTGFVKKNWEKMKDKDVVVITCGAAPAGDSVTKKFHNQIPEEIRKKIRIFTLQGATPGAKGEAQAKKIKRENIKEIVAEFKK